MLNIKQQRQATADGIARAAKYAFPDDYIARIHYALDSGPIGKSLVRSFLAALTDEQLGRLVAEPINAPQYSPFGRKASVPVGRLPTEGS